MPTRIGRREFLLRAGAMAGAVAASPALNALAYRLPPWAPDLPGSNEQASAKKAEAHSLTSPFRVSIINDEISQDFGRACEVAAREFGMTWIELRGMWKKNIVNLDSKEIAEARRILDKYGLRVTDIASPLFKVDWAGAPRSKYSEHNDFHADFTFNQQDA